MRALLTLVLLLLLAVPAGCGRGRTPAAGDAGPSARAGAAQVPSGGAVGQGDPPAAGWPLVPCPLPGTDGDDLDALLDTAATRYDAGDFAAALACAERAGQISPRSVEAHHDRAIALTALGRLEEARVAYTLALALDPDDPLTLADAADFYVNRIDASREGTYVGLEYARRGSARAGRRREDRQLAARLALIEAQALDDLGASDEALARADAALALDPASSDARFQRGVALFHLCRLEAANRVFEEVLARTPDDPYAHHHLGLLLEREGRAGEAEAHFARARALAPDEFPPPVAVSAEEFAAMIRAAVAELEPGLAALLEGVPVEAGDLPALEDLTAVDPPFAPTILGLCRGAPRGPADAAATVPGEDGAVPPSIVLYRRNLARAVRSRAELERQVRVTLWHELGHLRGEDEDQLRTRGLE